MQKHIPPIRQYAVIVVVLHVTECKIHLIGILALTLHTQTIMIVQVMYLRLLKQEDILQIPVGISGQIHGKRFKRLSHILWYLIRLHQLHLAHAIQGI